MSNRRFRRSFVLTVSTIAAVSCSKPPDAIDPVGKESKPTTEDAAKVEPKEAAKPRHRVRTAKQTDKPDWAKGPIDYAKLVRQNPNDASGRAIYVASDDGCYVQLPMKSPPKNMVPGMRWYDPGPVDCPPELDDPAWDDCIDGTLSTDTAKGECYCDHPGGNPPPPPFMARCPKHKK